MSKALKATGLYFGDQDSDREEQACLLVVKESTPRHSYDRGVHLLITGNDPQHTMSVVIPTAYAQRFCSMILTGEYLTKDFQDGFDELSSVNDLMRIGWVNLAPKQDFCFQHFAFGKSDDGRYTITIRKHMDRYKAGSRKAMRRYLVYLSEQELHDFAHELQRVVAFLRIKGKVDLRHDS